MLFQNKIDRAFKYQHEQAAQNEIPEEYNGEKLYEPTLEDMLDKKDMFSLIVSAWITIVPACLGVLLLIVFIAQLIFRIF